MSSRETIPDSWVTPACVRPAEHPSSYYTPQMPLENLGTSHDSKNGKHVSTANDNHDFLGEGEHSRSNFLGLFGQQDTATTTSFPTFGTSSFVPDLVPDVRESHSHSLHSISVNDQDAVGDMTIPPFWSSCTTEDTGNLSSLHITGEIDLSPDVGWKRPQPFSTYNTAPQASDFDQTAMPFSPTDSAVPSNEIQTPAQPNTIHPGAHVPIFHWTQDERNEFLLEKRDAGWSYKTIKEYGSFKEAESTLRGRYRALKKLPEDRVRKPRWTDKDVELLQIAVQTLQSRPRSNKKRKKGVGALRQRLNSVPWKEVAQFISEHGGSYHFGNATCRKKFEETSLGG